MNIISFLWNYWRVKKRTFRTREELETYQKINIKKFIENTLSKSPYFSRYLNLPLSEWPLMNKTIMMENFDQMNTAGLKLEDLLDCAFKAEKSRDFDSTIGEYSVGLSSGTSNLRGVFVASKKERTIWASNFLAKCLPRGLFHGERVALFLRADNKLYNAVNNRWISFKFFDLFSPFQEHIATLNEYKPTIIVGPSQVLQSLAKEKIKGSFTFVPDYIFSAAEVLEPLTKQLLIDTFGAVSEIYQATEGFLGITCKHGTMHLNEDLIFVEKEWLDKSRFVPIITDFVRATQPIVRYRLDDILVVNDKVCPCGSPFTAIERIEGRLNDALIFDNENGEPVTIFADLCSRIFAQTLSISSDYQLTQDSKNHINLYIETDEQTLNECKEKLLVAFKTQGVDINDIEWSLFNKLPEQDSTAKRRRIKREQF